MNVTFYGAVREVTGSMHLVATEHDRVLLDCGLFQGRRRECEVKNRALPFDPRLITNALLSHAHIDHSGRIPLLTRKRFCGRIIATRATAEACRYLLLDSASIQESDADYLNYKTVRNHMVTQRLNSRKRRATDLSVEDARALLKGDHQGLKREVIDELIRRHHLDGVRPLYTTEEAEASLAFFDGYPYATPVTVGQSITATFYDAGHILGSALVALQATDNGGRRTVMFTGDVGRFGKPIVRNPTLVFADADRDVDLLIMESTYGDRLHEPVQDLKGQLHRVVAEANARGGTVLVPAFAYGRTQEIVYLLHELYDENRLPRIPIYVDSPLAAKLTRVFGEHPETYDQDAQETFLRRGENPFQFPQLHYVASVEESMALNRDERPHIVIAGSGMCEGGRILHHLRHKIHDRRHTILIVGFMAQHTLGRRLVELGVASQAGGGTGEPPTVRFLNKEYPLKARVERIGGFSGHADRDELLRFLRQSNLRVRRIAVVHGEEEQSLAFAEHLRAAGYNAMVPHSGETIALR
jgi:metallo-beta-lactamase family protein